MRLTVYTDYTLRVMIYLTLKYKRGEKATIPDIAESYGISRSHLTKIVHELSLAGFIETVRGRSGGIWLARPPEKISVGEVVRYAERDFSLVECHEDGRETDCAVSPVCNLNKAFRSALNAFFYELDRITLEDSVATPGMAASLLGVGEPGHKVIPIVLQSAAKPGEGASNKAVGRRKTAAAVGAKAVKPAKRKAVTA